MAAKRLVLLLAGLLLAALRPAPAPAAHDGSYAPESYLVYYGHWDDVQIQKARGFDLIVLHPGRDLTNITKAQIQDLKNGADGKPGTEDDAKVITYISIGEADHIPFGPAKPGEPGTGPVYWDKDKGIVPMNNGYPSWLLDHRSYRFGKKGFYAWKPDGNPDIVEGHDGVPDENGRWGSYFVNVGDPGWQKLVLDRMRLMIEKFDPDGFFLDTLDSASEWGDYGWMQEAMAKFVRKIGDAFPERYMIGNRGFYLPKNYPDLVRPALDGLMFESFISEWDWYRKKGYLHNWLTQNHQILIKDVLPQAGKPDGFHLYMLNYLDPMQSDFFNLNADLYEVLKGVRYTSYISTPDLQKIFPKPEAYYSKEKAAALPEIKTFAIGEIGKGRYMASIEAASDDPGLTFGKDVFVDLRYSADKLPENELLLASRVEIDYDLLPVEKREGGYAVTVDSFGLHDFKEYYFYLKLIGRHPEVRTPVKRAILVTKGGKHPDVVTDLKAEGREKSVVLSWKTSQEGVERYNVYMGAHPQVLTKVDTVSEREAVVRELRNLEVYYFSVSAVDKDGAEGGLAYPVPAAPRKSAQPLPPKGLTVKPADGHGLFIKWKPSPDEQLAGYRVYCFRSDRRLRLPLKVDKKLNELTIPGLEPGKKYTVFVTAVDFDNIQSPPGKRRKAKVR
ncbi:MAG: fibronectin type III domain-containing protein [Elusimicrobiota bacterium]